MKLGVLIAIVLTGFNILVALVWDYRTMPDAFRDLWIMSVGTLVAAVIFSLPAMVWRSPKALWLGRFIFGFCAAMGPLCILSAIVCFATGQAKWGGVFLFWSAASVGGAFLSVKLTSRAEADYAYEGAMQALEYEQARARATRSGRCPHCGQSMTGEYAECPLCGTRM